MHPKFFSCVVVVSPGKFNFHQSQFLSFPEIDFRPLLEQLEERKLHQLFPKKSFSVNAVINFIEPHEHYQIDRPPAEVSRSQIELMSMCGDKWSDSICSSGNAR